LQFRQSAGLFKKHEDSNQLFKQLQNQTAMKQLLLTLLALLFVSTAAIGQSCYVNATTGISAKNN